MERPIFRGEPSLGYSTGIESVHGETRSIGDDVMYTLFGFSGDAPEHLAEHHARCQVAAATTANGATVVQLADALFPWLLSLRETEPLED